MFEQLFKEASNRLGIEDSPASKSWLEISTSYSDPKRHYHNLTHLDNVAKELTGVKETLSDWPIILMALAYHDIVYDPLQHDNEEKSAGLAAERLTSLNIENSRIEKWGKLILATRAHQESPDTDINYLLMRTLQF